MIPCVTLVALYHLVKRVWPLTRTIYWNAYVLGHGSSDFNRSCFGKSCQFLSLKASDQMRSHPVLIKSNGLNVISFGSMVSSSNAKKTTHSCWSQTPSAGLELLSPASHYGKSVVYIAGAAAALYLLSTSHQSYYHIDRHHQKSKLWRSSVHVPKHKKICKAEKQQHLSSSTSMMVTYLNCGYLWLEGSNAVEQGAYCSILQSYPQQFVCCINMTVSKHACTSHNDIPVCLLQIQVLHPHHTCLWIVFLCRSDQQDWVTYFLLWWFSTTRSFSWWAFGIW